MKYQNPYRAFYKPLSFILLLLGFSSFGWAEKTPRFNTFRIVSIQAGSTTDIDDLKVVDLDTDQVVYQNNFSAAGDAKRDLNLFYYPEGGKDTTNFSVDDQKNRIVNGKLRLETTGYRANGRGGYNSHSDAEFSGSLPQNFLVEFHAKRLQWAGHFFFQVFYKDRSDSLSSHELGGAFSTQRKSDYRNDRLQFHGEGSWFNAMSLVVPGVGTPVTFPAPKINLQHGHRLGISLNGSTVGFYVDGKLLNSGDVSDYIKEVVSDGEIPRESGLIAHYAFDGDALDQSENRNHGVLEDAVFMKDRFGKEGSALSPVTTETINFSQTLNGSRSISFWMKVAKLNVSSGTWGIKRNTQLIGLPNVTDNFDLPHCGYFEDETLSWDTGRGMRFYSSAGNDLMDLSQWNHVTYVYTGSLASSQVFYNAKLLSPTQTIGGSKDNFANSNQLVLLGQENSGNAFDDIRIYDRVLSSDEVLELYELEKAPANAEEIILGFDLRMVEIDSNGPVSLGYPKYNEIEVSLPKFKISGETVTFGTWSKVRKAAQKELGWELIEGVQGSGYDDTNELHPVTKIGFLDAVLWCNALSKLAGLDPSYSVQDEDGKSFVFEPTLRNDAKERGIHMNPNSNGIRVPTGNEWEVAARGGLVGKKYPWGNEYPGKTRANWYVGNGMPNSTTEVGSYPENGYGLFDMAGGVWEMTWDDALQPDVETPAVLSDRYINRGGAWNAGWSPEVSTNGWSIKFDDRRHEFGFRVAANGASMGKPRPPVGPPTGTPEPLVDYIKLLREIMEEIAKVESELNDLSEQTVQKDAEIEKLESELVSINSEINDARVQLADCLEDCNRTREEMAQVQKETLTHNLTIVGLEGELRASAERLNSLRNDRDGMVKQITKIEKDMEEATAKLNTAHTPGWHYVPAYGWLWTSPEHYPLIYSNEREGWVYYERGTSDPWLYFDYKSEKWEQWFHDAPLFSSNN